MIRSIRGRLQTRAPRVNLQGIVSAALQLENGRQLTGKFRTLSITGGLLDLATYLDERTNIVLVFRFGPVFVQSKAQLLFPMRGGMGYLQPFRFTSLGVKEQQAMSEEISLRLKETFAQEQSNFRLGVRPPSHYLDTL
jgi:hypothetical protein